MSKLSKSDANLAQLLKQANPCEGQSCSNCIYVVWETREDWVDLGYSYCTHPESGQDDQTGFYPLLEGYVEAVGYTNLIEDAIGSNCPFYAPIMAVKCTRCNAPLNQADHLTLKAFAFSQQQGYDAVPVCSPQCAAQVDEQGREKYEQYVTQMRDKILHNLD